MTSTQQRAELQRQIWSIANDDNDYNLFVSSYVEVKDTREKIDITSLNAQLKITVTKIDQLRADIDTIVAEIEGDTA